MKLKRVLTQSIQGVLGFALALSLNTGFAQSVITPYQGRTVSLHSLAKQPLAFTDIRKTIEGVISSVTIPSQKALDTALTAIVVDSGDTASLDFIKRVVRPYDKDKPLSLHFEPHAYHQNEATALCLYPYDKTLFNYLLKSYDETGLFNRREALLHLGFRAAALCLLAQQQSLDHYPKTSEHERQLLADSFSFLLFALSGQEGFGARLVEHYALSADPASGHYAQSAYLRELSEFIDYLTMLFHTSPPQELIASVWDAFYLATNQPSKITINSITED